MFTKLYRTYSTEDFILDENFRKIIRGKLGSTKFLEKLIEKLPEKSEEIELAVGILQELNTEQSFHSSDYKRKLWQEILHQHKRRVRLQFFRYAATILLLLGFGSASYYLLKKQPSLEDFAASNKVSYKNAALILADGKKIDISSKESKVQYTTDGVNVSVNDTTKMGQENADNGFNQLIVPYGKRSTITLSDGTKVWLNSGSRLVYTPAFTGKSREVYLEGEGYFEVTKNEKRPFFVRTDAIQVKVYGTKFDVQAYKSDNEYSTILIEGKISLDLKDKSLSEEIFLTPNQKASLSKEQREIQLSNVENFENYIGWIDGYLTFQNETVSELIKQVAHYYNITIDSRLEGNLTKISGKLDLKDDPERVVNTLALISKTRYFKRDNKYLFYE
jgi:transmembrane sensor